MAITTRSGKGSALTHSEMDTNLNQIPNGANSSITDNGANVGIGTASPVSLLHVHQVGTANATVIIERATGNTAKLTSGASTGFTIDSDNTNGGEAITRFTQNGTEKLRILPTGGITFNGDTSTANALDDYEEGTWTPSFFYATNFSATLQAGTYTKTGNMVFCEGRIEGISMDSDNSQIHISGLPFSASANRVVSFTLGRRMDFLGSKVVKGADMTNYNNVVLWESHNNNILYSETARSGQLSFAITYNI
jgi:hypothetical protein